MEQHRLTASQYLLHQLASHAQGPREPRMRVVMVGINYVGTSNRLNGCVNDTVHLSQILKTAGARPQIKLLVDAGYNGQPVPAEAVRPTKANILAALEWLVSDAQPGDRLLFHYSGHGVQIPGNDAGEEDGMDEALVPCDFMQVGGMNARGCISDDVIRAYWDRLPAGVVLHQISDCCHSATMADLKFAYSDLCRASKRVQTNTKRKETAAQVIAISGCQDYQTSADAFLDPPTFRTLLAQGALSNSLIQTFYDHPEGLSWADFVYKVCGTIAENNFSQRPLLTSGRPLDLDGPCSFYDFLPNLTKPS